MCESWYVKPHTITTRGRPWERKGVLKVSTAVPGGPCIHINTKEPLKFPGRSLRFDASSRDTLQAHARIAGSEALHVSLSAGCSLNR